MKRSSATLLVSALSVAWLIILVIVFIVISHWDFVHIYFLPLLIPLSQITAHVAPGKYVLDLLVAMLGAIIFSAACVSVGLLFLRDWQDDRADYLAVGTTAFLLGEIIFSVIFLTVIIIYQLTPQITTIALALGLLLGATRLAAFLRACPPLRLPAEFGRAERVIIGLAALAMTAAVLYTAAILGYDATVQYFSQAKVMAVEQTAVYTFPQDPFVVSSFHSGILYTAQIELFGDQSARMLSWINGLAIVLLGLAIGVEAGISPKARLWFLALMLTSTAFVDLLGDGKVELISTAPLLAGIYWMLRALKRPNESAYAVIGLLLGFAMIARPYNIFLAPLFVVVFFTIIVVTQRRSAEFDLKKLISCAIWMLPSLMAMGAFHLLQNWLWLGNPIAPLVNGAHVSASSWQWQFDPKLLNVYRLLYPLVATFSNSPQSLGNVSPFVLGFIPFLFAKRVRQALRERPTLMRLLLAAAVTLVLWLILFFTVVEIRYVWFLWMIFFLAVAQIMDEATEYLKPRLGGVVGLLVGVSLVYMAGRTAVIALDTYSPIDKTGQAHCYYLGFCTFLEPLNQAAQPGERVFVVNAYRYYLRPDLFACASRAQEYPKLEALAQSGSPDFWTEAYRRGFRYVTYENNYANFHAHFGKLPSIQSTPVWLHVTELSSTPDRQQIVFRIDATQPPIATETYCRRNSAGIWEVKLGTPASQE